MEQKNLFIIGVYGLGMDTVYYAAIGSDLEEASHVAKRNCAADNELDEKERDGLVIDYDSSFEVTTASNLAGDLYSIILQKDSVYAI